MVFYPAAAGCLWALSQANGIAAATAVSTKGNTSYQRAVAANNSNISVTVEATDSSADITARCDAEVDSTVHLYVISEDDLAAGIALPDGSTETDTMYRSDGAGDGSPEYPNSTSYFMEQVHLPHTKALQSANIGSSWVSSAGQKTGTGFITLIRSNDQVGDQVM